MDHQLNKDYNETAYTPRKSFLRVATATPEVDIAHVGNNIEAIGELYEQATKENVALVTFPEMSLTGYSIGDLVQSQTLLDQAEQGLIELSQITKGKNTAMVVGLPLRVGNAIYNCAALLANGIILGVVPKQNLPTYKEFYEKRWFQSWDDRPNIDITIGNQKVPFGPNQLFTIGGSNVGIEICEDLWVPQSPHERLVANSADVIVNPSASPELATKADYRRQLIGSVAAKQVCTYVYANADPSESTMDVVMSGHCLVSEGGRQIAERKPFSKDESRLMIADVDQSHIMFDRRQNTNFPNEKTISITQTGITSEQIDLRQAVDPYPFLPKGTLGHRAERLNEILSVQAIGLAQRLKASGCKKMVMGLSGGLDSTLALMVCLRAAEYSGLDPQEAIDTLTMPSVSSSDRTQNNALKLADAVGVSSHEIPIAQISQEQLAALQHSGAQDVTFENVQARMRTSMLFNHANSVGGLVVGTGDLSEIALGWSTYNGDHMSHYNPNASIPKTLIRELTWQAAQDLPSKARGIIADIIDTPISPELIGDGTEVSQETESIIGPYELHDFFEYHFVRWMEPFDKIEYLANQAFAEKYEPEEIRHWLKTYVWRFFGSQWKRSVMPDGPKVGTVSHSPRGDWRMPSDTRNAKFAFYDKLGLVT